jgi:hypothetical protein
MLHEASLAAAAQHSVASASVTASLHMVESAALLRNT